MYLFHFERNVYHRCKLCIYSWSRKSFHTSVTANFWLRIIAHKHTPKVVSPRVGEPITVHNHFIQDDFSWLQDLSNKEVRKIIEDENRYADYVMKDTKSFQEKFITGISKLCGQVESEFSDLPVELGNHIYYTEESRNNPNFLVHCRIHKDIVGEDTSSAQVLFDETSVAGHWSYIAVKTMKISPSEKYVAFVADTSGTDTYCGILVDTRKNPGTIIEQLPCVNMEWSYNDNVLYYTTFDHLKRANKVWRHILANDCNRDELIYEETDERFYVDVSCTKDRRFITINSNSKSTSEVHVVDSNEPRGLPRLIRPRQSGIEYYVEHHDGTFYFLTNLPDGENYQVMFSDVDEIDSKKWGKLMETSPVDNVILDDMDIFSDFCVLYQKQNTVPKITIVPLNKPSDQYKIDFPEYTSVVNPGYNLDFNSKSFNFTTSSPIQPPTLMEINLETKLMEFKLPQKNDSTGEHYAYSRTQIHATSKDGTVIPITLFHKKDLKLDGRNPMLFHVYGSYGMNVNMDFSLEKLYLLSQNWILAFCHVRGGGEFGRTWYHKGRALNKTKAFQDFESCIQRSQYMGYTSPSLTAIKATSAGGLPVAVLCNNTPHLAKAVVLKVPLVDVMTAMLNQDLELTAQEFEEFGNPLLDIDAFNNIRSFCPYMNIKSQKYPDMLFMSSVKDIRVPYWMPLKFVKKLRYLSSTESTSINDHMLLLKTDFESGHFGAGTVDESAFICAFLYKSLGILPS